MVDPLVATTVVHLEVTAVVPLGAVEVVLVSQAVPIQVTTQHLEATHAVHLVVLLQRHLLLHATTTLPEIITLLHRVFLTVTVAHLEVAVAVAVVAVAVAAVAVAAEASVVAAAIVAAVIGNK